MPSGWALTAKLDGLGNVILNIRLQPPLPKDYGLTQLILEVGRFRAESPELKDFLSFYSKNSALYPATA
jgi:hypothetical protein